MGSVTFVGGGPYDSSYLSQMAIDALANADCVLYDHLLDEQILTLTKGVCIYVGKQAGKHSMKQAEINALLVKQAQKFTHVVRLKGGDSFVFGRGGEEALALQAHQIPYTFVPGISSVIAATECAHIPLTHRGVASGFQVLSAHLQNHQLGIQPDQLRHSNITQVILMGLSRVEEICSLCKAAGRDRQTPIAVISKGCSPKQEVLCGTIDDLPEKLRHHPLSSPAMIVIGEVVRLRDAMTSRQLPLSNLHVLVTKTQISASPLTQKLRAKGASVTELALGHIQYVTCTQEQCTFPNPTTFVFTSKHGIHAFFQAYLRYYDIRTLMKHRFLVIGEQCAEALRTYGIRPDGHANGQRSLLISILNKEQRPIQYWKGNEAASLKIDHTAYTEQIVYENQCVDVEMDDQDYDVICFTCASSGKRIPVLSKKQCCLSIGPTTSDALRMRGAQTILEAPKPSYDEMVKTLCEHYARINQMKQESQSNG